MPINNIEFAKIMMQMLDQQASIEATSGWMEANAGQVKYTGGDTVRIPTMTTQGLGDYDRDNGFPQGAISVTYKEYTMTQDRGRTFHLDRMDEEESNFVATAGNILKTFQTEHVVPEIDSYRYSKLASIAIAAGGTEAVALSADTALTKVREHIRAITDVIGDVPLIITMPSNVLALIEDSPKVGKHINVGEFKQGNLTFKVKKIDDHVIRVVPSARLKTKYTSKDGKTSGQEAGGLVAADDAKDINYLITPARVPIAINKTDKLRIFTPDVNQKADAYKIDYRKYHDLWVLENKKNQIFVCTTA